MLPPTVWKAYADKIAAIAEFEDRWTIKKGILAFPCPLMVNLPNLYFMFEDYWLQMDPKDYVFEASDVQPDGEKICGLAITGNFGEFFLFGNSFLRGYYTIHDMKDGELGVIPHATSQKDFVTKGDVSKWEDWPIFEVEEPQSMWTWIIISGTTTSWALVMSLAIHPILLKEQWDYGAILALEQLSTAGFGALTYFLIVPELNKVFLGDGMGVVDPGAVESAPRGEEEEVEEGEGDDGKTPKESLIAVFGGLFATTYAAKHIVKRLRASREQKKSELALKEEGTDAELLSKLSELI